jgi:SAM-dependent methyltransferase
MTVSEIDKQHYVRIRENIKNFIKNLSEQYDSEDLLIMDVAPEIHMGAKEFFKKSTIKTLDIDPESGADYIVDLCETNSDKIKDETFDLILCTEVLEHVNDPFSVVNELERILKVGGIVAVSTPFNFRMNVINKIILNTLANFMNCLHSKLLIHFERFYYIFGLSFH